MLEPLIAITQKLAGLTGSERILLVTPGPHGAALLPELLAAFPKNSVTVLESSLERLFKLSSRNPLVRCVRGQVTRLPFQRHAFDAVLSFEALYSIRPPWTALAEFHRVLVPNGTLILTEPSRLGFFSTLRDKISGPGKRVFSLEEIKFRLARGDYAVQSVEHLKAGGGMARPTYAIKASKIENDVEPAPQFTTAKEMLEKRKNRPPKAS